MKRPQDLDIYLIFLSFVSFVIYIFTDEISLGLMAIFLAVSAILVSNFD